MQTKLLGGFSIKFDNVGIGLYLRGTKLSPEFDDLLAGGLDIRNATVIFLIDTGKFRIEGCDIRRGKIEAWWDS